jgi:acyl carrier protein
MGIETDNNDRGWPMIDRIRTLLAQNPMIPIDVEAISDSANLYDAGLTSFASVQLMLAIEEEFDIEFPEDKLTRRTFSSIGNIAAAVSELTAEPV